MIVFASWKGLQGNLRRFADFTLITISEKLINKNLSGKSDEREVKMCKNRLFTLHPSFFILRKTSFHSAKGKLWLRQSLCLVAWNMVFHTMKPYLSCNETLPLANSFFVNRQVTDKQSRNHLPVNALRETSKIALFSTKNVFVQTDGLYLGSKFE